MLQLDIDDFKHLTASLNNIRGDQLLCKVADILKEYFGKDNLVCRMSILRFKVDGISISCSIGACMYPEYGNDYQILYHNADIALLISKFLGKNQYLLFDKNSVLPSHTLFRCMDKLLDEVSEAIIVCDAENYNLLYINELGCKIADKYKKDCLGQECYKVLWNRDKACEHCINVSNLTNSYCSYETDKFAIK